MNIAVNHSFNDDMQLEWNTLLSESISHVPFLRFEYLRTWWKHLGGGEWTAKNPNAQIITAYNNQRAIGIAPLFHAMHENRPSLLLLGSIEISDYLDLIVRPSELQPFVDSLLPFLASDALPAWDEIDLYNLLETSPSIPALQNGAAGLGWKTDLQASAVRSRHPPARRLGAVPGKH